MRQLLNRHRTPPLFSRIGPPAGGDLLFLGESHKTVHYAQRAQYGCPMAGE